MKEEEKLFLNTMKIILGKIENILYSDEAYCYYYFMEYLKTKNEVYFNYFKEKYDKLDDGGKIKFFIYVIEGNRKENKVMIPKKSKIKK